MESSPENQSQLLLVETHVYPPVVLGLQVKLIPQQVEPFEAARAANTLRR